MDSSDPFRKPAGRWIAIGAWGIFAAVVGLGCAVLPPFLIPGAIVNPSYGHPLISWFASAYANVRPVPTLYLLGVLGVVLGLAQPRWWPLSSGLTVSLILILWSINFIHDVALDPTSHNLFPFEIAIIVFLALPVLAGGSLGCLIRWALRRSRANSSA